MAKTFEFVIGKWRTAHLLQRNLEQIVLLQHLPPPIRKTRLAKQVELVVNECGINVQDLNARKKRLRLQFEKDMRKLDREVNA